MNWKEPIEQFRSIIGTEDNTSLMCIAHKQNNVNGSNGAPIDIQFQNISYQLNPAIRYFGHEHSSGYSSLNQKIIIDIVFCDKSNNIVTNCN